EFVERQMTSGLDVRIAGVLEDGIDFQTGGGPMHSDRYRNDACIGQAEDRWRVEQGRVDRKRDDVASPPALTRGAPGDTADLISETSVTHHVDALSAKRGDLGPILRLKQNWVDNVHAWRRTNRQRLFRLGHRLKCTSQSCERTPIEPRGI